MPDRDRILLALTSAANDGFVLAVLWHSFLGAVLFDVAGGWRPSRREAGLVLSVPLVSVSFASMIEASFFNAVVFAVLAVALAAVTALPGGSEAVTAGAPWARILGAAVIAFGWTYPHFLSGSLMHYAYAAPVGLIPCPTLAILVGFGLLSDGLHSHAWSWVVGAAAAAYAGFGAVHLGVWLDLPLLLGAGVLVYVASGGRKDARMPRADANHLPPGSGASRGILDAHA
jgi:hypothetical protein